MPEVFSCLNRRYVRWIITVFLILINVVFIHSRIHSQDSQQNSDTTSTSNQATSSSDTTSTANQATASSENGIPTDPDIIDKGHTLFRNNCSICHAINEQVVGPALKGVYNARPIPWILSFVKNSQKVIQGGDEFASQLYQQFNNTVMPSFDFSDDEILSILAYIKQQTENPPQQAAQTTQSGGGGQQAAQATSGTTMSKGFLIAVMIGLVVVLILILVVMLMLVTTLTKYLKQREGSMEEEDIELVEQHFDLKKFVRSPAFVFGVAFIFTAIVAKTVIDGLYDIGVQQGYQPTQPIAYSHKVHAGQYKIPCEYCHTGVSKAKNANIPSANICMNCHSMITKVTGSDQPSPEIQKIYDAVENNKPIEWVRVHNLPDLAYFNHAQHYKVGNIECQTCHGPIEEMEVVRQYSLLTMGWCIDCHRKTVIQKDNAYYDKLVELHNQTEPGKDMTVEDIGGTECARCHY